MTTPPLPDIPCVRVRLDYTHASGLTAGSRFYLSYSGSAPTGANCTTLATDIANLWVANVEGEFSSDWTLVEVDVLDIATDSGLSGTVAVSHSGTDAGTSAPAQCALNVEFDISRRYRGGKPRMYWPPGLAGDLNNDSTWNSAKITSMNTAVVGFFNGIEALSIGAMGTLTHVNLSYYKGFTNITNSSGRERAVPKYRDTAIHDNIVGYATKSLVGSQRRRRTSTTP
jgi:hypothetical protein